MSKRVQIPRQHYVEMVEHARLAYPEECCGFLAGVLEGEVAHVRARYELTNQAASPVRYQAEPRDLFVAFKAMRIAGWELLAIYHSHPTSEPVPSRTDLANNFYGEEILHLIVSLQGEPQTRGWHLAPDHFREATWEVVDSTHGGDGV